MPFWLGACLYVSSNMTIPYESVARYESPPRTENAKGETRGVGLEIELGRLTLEETLQIVHSVLGGEIISDSRTEGSVRDTPFGKFKVEVDSVPLKERSYLLPVT